MAVKMITAKKNIKTSKLQELSSKTFIERKNIFLNRYKSLSGKTKYKRYIGAPLRYAGGKSLAVGLIVELLPDSIKRLVSILR